MGFVWLLVILKKLLKALWGGQHRRPSIYDRQGSFELGEIKHAFGSWRSLQEVDKEDQQEIHNTFKNPQTIL